MALIARLGPPLALMALIFFLSAQSSLDSGLGTVDFIARKLVHMAEFGLLFALWLRALPGPRAAPTAAAIAIAYAITDELHQTFVAGRTGSPIDVLIDTAGVAVAYFAIRRSRPSRSQVTTVGPVSSGLSGAVPGQDATAADSTAIGKART